ncbi:MAG TPA: NAD(P)/FAD-dependent oxidoreductase [Armatimonadaceae bacterium]|nr:NAD(P)/FAD-dependent oxidoreductase [Armatimonadaceae bacterium]
MPGNVYDALILGGGPAGLSAAVYLGRFTRSVLVVDAGEGRSSFQQRNDNYLGFPEGVTTRDLRDLGRRQAERFGVAFRDARVERVEAAGEDVEGRPVYRAVTTDGDFDGRTVLFATGVTDIWPEVPGVLEWVGVQVFWCITCDGYRTQGKRLVCVGNDDEAATTTLQFLLFTDRLTLVADPEKARFSDQKRRDLEDAGVPVVYARPASFSLSPDGGTITAVCLDSGELLPCDLIFSLLGVRPNTQLAREMGLALDGAGYVVIDEEGYTTLPGVFAAGDLTGLYTQQVASAVHAGAEAAQTMNYYLYKPFQRNAADPAPAETALDPVDVAEEGA